MPTSVNFDENLVERLRKGDRFAFSDIYEKYWYSVFRVAYRRVRDKEIAKELTQDLFAKIWERREKLKIEKLENYLMIAMKNSVLNHIESQIVADRYVRYYKAFISIHNEATESAINFNDLSEAIDKGLTNLPEKSRMVFKLNKLDHWPVEKVALHLNLSEKTVGYHLTKSLKFMRTFLREFTLVIFLFVFGY